MLILKHINNQSCKHDLKLISDTVTVTDADDHYHGDGGSVIRAADGQWWTVTIMIEDVWNWTRTKPLKLKRFIKTIDSKVKTANPGNFYIRAIARNFFTLRGISRDCVEKVFLICNYVQLAEILRKFLK